MTKKGFTLIELLVVIAIIGILAGILFVAINPKAQTDKANDATKLSELAQARTQAALSFSDNNNSFANVHTDIGDLATCADANDDDSAWAAYVTLDVAQDVDGSGNSSTIICADSTGVTRDVAAAPAGTSCGAAN